jgi:glutathione S-transferase
VAHEALLEAGYRPDIVRCYGWEALPRIFNQTPGRRKVKELTGEAVVPVLVTDDGEVVTESAEIAAWARRNPAVA